MTNNFSYSDVEARLKAFADGHYIIKRYSVGEATDFEQTANPDESNAALWPLMHVIHPQVTLAQGAVRFELEVLFADLPREFEERNTEQVEVLSNLIRLCQDLGAAIKNTPYILSDSASIEGDIRIETIGRARFNSVCVTRLLATIELPYDWNACDIPANFVFGQASGGGGWPWPFPPTGDWCDKLVYCPVTQYILQQLEDKLSFVSVDGVTIIGDGTPSNPLVAVGGGGGGAVASVNGQTGVVVLDANDVGADPVGSAATAESNANNYTDTELQNYVQSVTGLDTDNTDPQNPAVQIAVDGVTITGSGTSADPLVAATGSGGVASVTGESVDNTDPANPVVNAWPLAGTGTDLVTGDIEIDPTINFEMFQDDGLGTTRVFGISSAGVGYVLLSQSNSITGKTLSFQINIAGIALIANIGANTSSFEADTNSGSDAGTYPVLNRINTKRWNFNGVAAPTVNDDASLGYGVDSGFIHDGTLYICQDPTIGAAVWVAQGGGSSLTIQTDGTPNGDQTLLNLIGGTNTTLTDDGLGNVTIDAATGILWVPVNTSLTAANKTFYVNIANATYTDPTGVDGEGFEVVVEAGTATIGGVGYSVRGTRIVRVFDSSVWTSYVYSPDKDSFAVLASSFDTTSDSLVNATGLSLPVQANSLYRFEFEARIGCSGTGGLRLSWDIPSGALLNGATTGRTSAVAAGAWQGLTFPAANETTTFANAASGAAAFILSGHLRVGSTAGNIVTQIRSITAGQTSTIDDLGGMKLTKIS
jgi:hypothetical protein